MKQSRITKSAKGQPCIRCGVDDGTIRCCHYNGFRAESYGKGRGIKCHDLASAELCSECDDMLSESNYHLYPGGSKNIERSELFLHLIIRTNIRRMDRGVITDGSKHESVPEIRSSKILPRHTENGVHTL